jgi:WD40 repeat protein
MWDRKPEGACEITAGLIPDEEKINDAIGEFYAGVVERIVEKTGVAEARLREWCGCELIQNQARAQTRTGPLRNEGDEAVLGELENSYLIRRDTRGETTWYELVHDRMVDAIIENNQRWQLQLPEDQRLLKAAAEQWQRKGESDYFLLRGSSVREAEQWAAKNPDALSDLERRFLQRSREHRDQAKRFKAVTAVMIAVCVLAIVAVVVAIRQRERAKLDRQRAEEVTREADLHRLAAAAASAKAQEVSVRAAREAAAAEAARAEVAVAEARAEANAARAADAAEAAKEMRSRAEQLQAEVQHRDQQLNQAKSAFDRFTAETKARLDKQEEELRRKTQEAEANLKDFTSVREGVRVRLRTVQAEARVTEQTRKDTLDVVAQLRRLLRDHQTIEPYSLSQLGQLLQSSLNERTLAYRSSARSLSTAGGGLVITTGDGAVRFPASGDAKPEERFFRLCEDKSGHQLVASATPDHSCAGMAWPTSIAAAPGGKEILVGFPNGRMYLWNWTKGTHVQIPAHRHPVVELSVRDDGKYAISASALWSFAVASLEGEPRRLYRRPNILKWVDITLRGGGTELVRSVAFLGKEGNLIAIGFDDGRVELWSSNRHKRWARAHGHRNSVLSLASDASGERLVSTSRDGSVVLWRIRTQQGRPALVRFTGYDTSGGISPEVSSSAYEPSGSMVALGTANGNIFVHRDSQKPYQLANIRAHRGRVNSLRFVDANTLASTGDDNATRVWRIAPEAAMQEMLDLERELTAVSRRYPEPRKASEADARDLAALLDRAEALLKGL